MESNKVFFVAHVGFCFILLWKHGLVLQDYVHRIGRTGRAGEKGLSCARDSGSWHLILSTGIFGYMRIDYRRFASGMMCVCV